MDPRIAHSFKPILQSRNRGIKEGRKALQIKLMYSFGQRGERTQREIVNFLKVKFADVRTNSIMEEYTDEDIILSCCTVDWSATARKS